MPAAPGDQQLPVCAATARSWVGVDPDPCSTGAVCSTAAKGSVVHRVASAL